MKKRTMELFGKDSVNFQIEVFAPLYVTPKLNKWVRGKFTETHSIELAEVDQIVFSKLRCLNADNFRTN